MENGNKLDNYNCCGNSRIYEDFVPTSESIHGKDYDTLLLNLPGFKIEDIKIELCKTGILKISGQRPVNKFLSFEKDIHVPTNCDKTKINAKLLNGILYVKHPKLIIPSEKNENRLSSSNNNEPKPDNKKPGLDEMNKPDNAEHSPAKQEQPKNHEQTQVVNPDMSMKDAMTPKNHEQTQVVNPDMSMKDAMTPKNHEQTQVVNPDKLMKDATTPSASDLAKLKVSRNVMNIALATLVVLGIGCCVVNMICSSKKSKD